jgi:multiple sugar transport system permease protein
MAIPTMVILAVVIGYPIVRAFVLAFFDYSLITGDAGATYVGLDNFRDIGSDPVFWQSLQNTVVFTVASLAGAGLAGVVLAFATENLDGHWRLLRGLLLTPWAIPVIVTAFLFRFLFLDRGGLANDLLLGAGLVESPVPWITSSEWALASVTIANIWQTAPFFLLVFTAGLRAVPNEVVEAARIDKTGPWALIWQIKLPFLRGPALVAALITTIENLNSFPLIWAMTEGGPGYSSSTLAIYAYRLVFTNFQLGYASSIGVVWLAFLMVIAWWFVRTLRGEKA